MSKLKQYKNTIIISVVVLLVGYGFGRYVQPARIQIQKEEVIKEVEVVKKDVRTVERETIRPDGTIEKEKITEDKSQERVRKEKDSSESVLVVNKKPDWRANALAAYRSDRDLMYGVQIERRISGPISVGVFGFTDKTIGLSIGLEF